VAAPEGAVHYEYDAATGWRTRTWTAHSETQYDYDERGRVVAVRVLKRGGDFLAVPEITRYSYTPDSQIGTITRPNGVLSSYQYDDLNRLVSLSHVGSNGTFLASYTYSLTPGGLRSNLTEAVLAPAGAYRTNRIAYEYDAMKRLVRERGTNASESAGYDVRYVYDLAGNRLSRVATAGGKVLTTLYTYDANDRLLVESNYVAASSSGASMRFPGPGGGRWDAWPTRPSSRDLIPAAVCYYALRSIPWLLVLAAAIPLFAFRGQLRRVKLLTTDLCPRRALAPRCLTWLLAGMMVVTSFDLRTMAWEAMTYTGLTTATWGLDGSTTTFEYDNNGSLTRKVTSGPSPETHEYGYDALHRLTSVTITRSAGSQPTVQSAKYVYNLQGFRVRSEVSTTIGGVTANSTTNICLVDQFNPSGYPQILEESTSVGAKPSVSYTIGNEVISQTRDGSAAATDYLLADGHGSTRQIATSDGVISDSYGYDAYGITLGGDPGAANPGKTKILHSGEQFDALLGQYFLRARFYDPHTGRFPTADWLPGDGTDPATQHQYAYCMNDPVDRRDPSGNLSIIETLGVLLIIHIVAALIMQTIPPAQIKQNAEVTGAILSYPYCPAWNTVLVDSDRSKRVETARLMRHFLDWYRANHWNMEHIMLGGIIGKWECVSHATEFSGYIRAQRKDDSTLLKFYHMRIMGYGETIQTYWGWTPLPWTWMYPNEARTERHTYAIARQRDLADSSPLDVGINFDSWWYFDAAPNFGTGWGAGDIKDVSSKYSYGDLY